VLGELIEAGQVTPAVDRTYELKDVPTAIGRMAENAVKGKLAITV